MKKFDLYNIVILEVRKINILGFFFNDYLVNMGGYIEVNFKYVFLVDVMLFVFLVGLVNM